MRAPHPDDIKYFRQRYGGTHSEIKTLLRHGYRYPVQVSNFWDSFESLREYIDDFDGYAVVSKSRRWSHQNVIWFNNSEKATMAKMIAG